MTGRDMSGIPFTGFPMQHPEMQIGLPAKAEQPKPHETSEYAQDTECWD
ncbi:MAG: hypothetical protein IKS42_01995 [Oscillospiraceae bacterium]|nr:hypothetical protein [Oscillospiraceae bacterium]